MSTHSSAPYLAARDAAPDASRSALLERVVTQWQALLRSTLAPLDLTPAQFRLLVAVAWLSARSRTVRQADVARVANADPVMTSEVLRHLEARGLIARTPHPTDGRAKAIITTDAGGALADRSARLIESVEAKFFEQGMHEFGPLAKALKKGGRGTLPLATGR